jgi:hypothetical protein
MSHLLPCPACHRHIEVVENNCPFCAAALPASFRAAQPAPPPARRLGRAALMAAGATLLGAAACNTNDGLVSDAGPRPPRDATVDRGGLGPMYGAPVPAYGIAIGTGGTTGAGGQVAAGGASGAGGATDAGPADAGDAARDAAARDAAQERTVIAIYGAATPAGATTPERSGNG